MSENVKVAEAEVVPTQALAVVSKDDLLEIVKENDKGVYKAMASMDTLDWKNLKPNQTAMLLTLKPFPVSGGGTSFLSFRQALLMAVRCHELGLSPFSDNVWFDPNKSSVNLTLSGKRELARLRGIDLGPPSFEEIYRDWKDVAKVTPAGEDAKKAGFTKDVGCKCRMRIGPVENKEYIEYTAWLNDWYVPKSPVWQNKPSHMLTVRANEKAVTLALGTGASAMPDEQELA